MLTEFVIFILILQEIIRDNAKNLSFFLYLFMFHK